MFPRKGTACAKKNVMGSFYIPRAHDAGRECGRVGEFFQMGRARKSGVRSQKLLVAGCWLLVEDSTRKTPNEFV